MSHNQIFKILVLGQPELEKTVSSTLALNGEGEIQRAASGKRAFDLVNLRRPNLVVLDFDLPRFKPLKFITQTLRDGNGIDIVAIAAAPEIDSVVKCIKLGVKEFIRTPAEKTKFDETLKKIYSSWRTMRQGLAFESEQSERFQVSNIIAQSPRMMEVLEVVQRVARRRFVTVLIRGETGTGKEVIARAIHHGGPENDNKPFVEVNCTAIPENLLESELFGYEKGAFTDARQSKKGLFEMANGGTLFLDEIGDMSAMLQAKLLKVIEEKRFRRLGGVKTIEVKLRIIAGTNARLEEKVAQGTFRSDLYFRLNVINIHLPPLCERGRDVTLLANYFIKKQAEEYGMPPRRFSSAAESLLLAFDWPGNVRELQNAIERIMLLNDAPVIEASDISSALGLEKMEHATADDDANTGRGSGADFSRAILIPREGLSLKDSEKQLIQETKHLTKGNKTHAAGILGISRPRLNRKIEEYGIEW